MTSSIDDNIDFDLSDLPNKLSKSPYLTKTNSNGTLELDKDAYDDLLKKTIDSLDIVSRAFDKYSPNEIAFSFNGGKDCCVLLHLIHYALTKKCQSLRDQQQQQHRVEGEETRTPINNSCSVNSHQDSGTGDDKDINTRGTQGYISPEMNSLNNHKNNNNTNHEKINHSIPELRTLYFINDKCFPSVNEFTEKCAKLYKLNVTNISKGIKEGLEEVVEKYNIKAVFAGARNTDPHCEHLDDFTPTDPGWPQLMRINPILQWNYKNVWQFIHTFRVPYCNLYDQGYTSIGHIDDTIPNPSLLDASSGIYKPAHHLLDGSLERCGRIKKK
ncbi:hypothetical protein DFA_02604 [Cavenderia fasciculata]|uniref:FAD synthase n=1 Tax=Cavenderia fasciculata TaxID=261658 RepID=F4PZV1_CACFS|nr:uncharacterized protein DFA_02604 [Cavenderia fasciculata]EGG18865.1 hypothetical protein DFA_02604 [Cavenderia fasciculata]|eukprot:XP_004357327.1 hypothetical protein DFA_02604 [Cavenderia fasciculata]